MKKVTKKGGNRDMLCMQCHKISACTSIVAVIMQGTEIELLSFSRELAEPNDY
jgi:hypothetical protein